jgi:ribosomal protein S18 acetylase RimI-like enzyme
VPVELRPSAELPLGDLAALFTAAYDGYFVPFSVDGPTLQYMVDVFGLDLASSLVALEDGTPIGLANLGRRGGRSWLGGVGVVPSRRRSGVGELLTRELLDRARAAGCTELVLEVIVENAPAIALYEKLGFAHTRELEVLALPPVDSGGGAGAEEAPLDAVHALVRARREEPEPWQRDDDTVGALAGREPPPQGLVAGDAAAIFRPGGEGVGLVQAAGGERGLQAIVAALRARGPVSAVNFPAPGAVAAVLRAAGAQVSLRQHEMVAPL